MLKCYIIDDEQQAVDALSALLKKKFQGMVQLVGSQTHAEHAIAEIELLAPDILFLDIEMPVLSGLEFLKHFPNRRFQVIYTTAHEKYALPALKAAAIDYLLKPLSPQDVHDAIQKCIRFHHTISQEKIEPSPARITLPSSKELAVVDIQSIIRVEANNNYSHFYFLDRPKLIVSKTLKEFEELLIPHHFFRVHQSHLVNLAHLDSIQTQNGDYAILKKGHRVEISRRKKPELLEQLKNR
ncbi:MAG: LytTR family DNA-binding domain-containing protein [Chitinophagaceae bacterium]